MSRIRSKDTSPEKRVRSLLHRSGYRYRLYVAGLPGKPDIVMPRFRTVIFVNGCFWHQHAGCRSSKLPKTNQAYWRKKFQKNKERDRDAYAALRQKGWTCLTIWECETKNTQGLAALLFGLLPPRHTTQGNDQL